MPCSIGRSSACANSNRARDICVVRTVFKPVRLVRTDSVCDENGAMATISAGSTVAVTTRTDIGSHRRAAAVIVARGDSTLTRAEPAIERSTQRNAAAYVASVVVLNCPIQNSNWRLPR